MKNSADQGGFEICRILHILRKPNSMIALLRISNIFKLVMEKIVKTASPTFSR